MARNLRASAVSAVNSVISSIAGTQPLRPNSSKAFIMPGGKTHRIRPRQSIKPGMAGSSMASIYPVQSRPQHDHNNDHNRYNDNTTHSLSPLSPPPVVCMWGTTYPPHTTDRKGRITTTREKELQHDEDIA